jgi:hypothetical protein
LASENAAAASQAASSSSETASAASETAAASSETAAASSATAAQTAQAAAEAAEAATEALFDQFGDQYLGPKASDPTVDNDGNPLVEGAVYFNTTDDVLKFYSGSAWVAPESIATTAATAAQAAQAAAETAETNAASSASSAASSASSASSSASAAATSASEAATNAASVNLNSIDIDGGTIDGTVIGGSVPAAGSFTTGSFTGNTTFADNAKATFGAGNALTVYHNGSNSFVSDQGVGDLRIQTNGNKVNLYDQANSNVMAHFNTGGSVDLYHNGSPKLVTSSSGLKAFSEVMLDPLGNAGGDSVGIEVVETGNNTTNMNVVRNFSYDTSNQNLVTFYNNANVGFYNIAGGTQRMLWDASDEALEFGDNVKATFGASADLAIFHDGSNSYITDNGAGQLYIGAYENPSTDYAVKIGNVANNQIYAGFNNGTSVDLFFNNSKKLETTTSGIDVNGTVVADGLTIGTTPQSSLFYLYGAPQATSGALATFRDSAASSSNTSFGSLVFSSSPGTDYAIGKSNVNSASTLSFRNANTGASYVDIDSSGRVGIGTSNPATELHVADTGESVVTIASTSAGSARINMVGAGGGAAFVTSAANSLYLETSTTSDIVIRTDATERLRVYGTSGNLEMTGGGSIGWANFTFKEESGYLYVYNGSTKIMRVDASGNAAFAGDVEANATL